MKKKLLIQVSEYLDSLKSDSPGWARAARALEDLKSALESIDPGDAMVEAARRAAGLPDSDAPGKNSDPAIAALRRAAGLPD